MTTSIQVLKCRRNGLNASKGSIRWAAKKGHPLSNSIKDEMTECCQCRDKHKLKDKNYSGADQNGYSVMLCPHCKCDLFWIEKKEVP